METNIPSLKELAGDKPGYPGSLFVTTNAHGHSEFSCPYAWIPQNLCSERRPSPELVRNLFRIVLTALLICGSYGIAHSAEEKSQVEIMHWWSSSGESAALDVFINRFEALGGHAFNSTKYSQSANREEAIERMSKGYPPSLIQWNAGIDVAEFYDYGLIDAITDPDLVEKLQRTLPDAVLDSVTHDGNIIAMPINIHSENWMWYSKELVPHSGSLLERDWEMLLELGEMLQRKNIPLLAVGDQLWQVRILFTSLLLGQSRDTYRKFYLDVDESIVEDGSFQKTFELFNRLAKFSRSFGDGNWDTQIKAVADEKAGATFMGDWAKGEFQVLGQTVDNEFGCALTGNSDPGLLLVIDAFILGKVIDPNEKNGQALMLDVVGDPQTNLQFNAVKGSVSPYATPPASQLDACSALVYEILSDNEAVILPYASYAHGNFWYQIDNAIYSFWKASISSNDDDALIKQTLADFKELLKGRSSKLGSPSLLKDGN